MISNQASNEAFLRTVPVIFEMEDNKVKEINRNLRPLLLIKDESDFIFFINHFNIKTVVFKKNDEANSIFILKSGKVSKKVPIFMEKKYKCPIVFKIFKIRE